MDTRTGEIKELDQIAAEEKKHFRALTQDEYETMKLLTPEQRLEWLEERKKNASAAAKTQPKDLLNGEMQLTVTKANACMNIAIMALKKIGNGAGFAPKLEARAALMGIDAILNPKSPMDDWRKTEKVPG